MGRLLTPTMVRIANATELVKFLWACLRSLLPAPADEYEERETCQREAVQALTALLRGINHD